MQHVLSTHLFVNQRLTTAGLERIRTAGFPAVEIFCARQHLDYHDKGQISEFGHWFRDSQLKMHSLHSPIYSDDVWGRSGPNAVLDITHKLKARRMEVVDEIKRAIEIAESVPFRYLIQHVGVVGEEMDERRWDSAFSSLDEIRMFAVQRGVEVLLENIPNAFSSAARLNDFLTMTHLKLGYCFDVGHAHIGNGVAAEFELMKTRIRSTHLHDNDGAADLHLFPGQGTVDWREAMRLLNSRPEQYPAVLELKEVRGIERPAEDAKRAVDDLDKYENDHE
ncbi:MAG TPA: sugar phosphate isomerase/epimerase family protein [Bryobacteraceae bacterium]|nr:sugar phosphate isomerase/epimerase family protein [Bryobacteraceae bacterium]